MNYRFCFVAILFSFSVALASFGADKHHENKKPKTDIRGHVYDKASKPLTGAILRLYDCDDSVADCGTPVGGARAIADGTFVVETKGMKAGTYTLEATMPPFYLAKAKVPIFIPQDYGKNFDFLMQQDTRDAAGNFVGVSADDAKEIYAAAKIEKNLEVTALSAKLLNQNEGPLNQPKTVYAQGPPSTGSPAASANGAQSDIQSALRKQLEADADNVTVSRTSHNSIQLTGTVSSDAEKRQAEQIAHSAAPNAEISNQLDVRGAQSATGSSSGSSDQQPSSGKPPRLR